MNDELPQAGPWLQRLRAGEPDALAALFGLYRPRLRQMVRLRLDARVAARLDPSDVVQETYVDAAHQLAGYLRDPKVAFYVWLRGVTWQRLQKLHRRHLGAECRAARREQPLPAESSAALARQLMAPGQTPSAAAVTEEVRRRLQAALAKLDADDREVILMRDFEELSNTEVAETLGLTASGATMRYGRALYRLKEILLTDGPSTESSS